MKNMDEIIIINAIPNSQEKIEMLERQIFYFKKLNKPIMVVSGCNVPDHIIDQIDYLIVNTDNEVIETDYSSKMYDMGLSDLSYDFDNIGEYTFVYYWKTVNSTITKNIKLAFNMANILGYKRAIYTEDDNIFKDGSFGYLYENLNAIRTGNYKMAGWIGHLDNNVPMMCTAFFFADIKWLLDVFTIPHMKDEWYDYETTVKYSFHRPYEYVFYKFFESRLDQFYNSIESYRELETTNENGNLMEFGKSNRRFKLKNIIDTYCTALKVLNENNKKLLVLNNKTYYLPSGEFNLEIKIHFDNQFINAVELKPTEWFFREIPDTVKIIDLEIKDYGTKTIDCSEVKLKNNGHVVKNS